MSNVRRAPICFALALLVHGGLLSAYLPRAMVQIGRALQDLLPAPALNAPDLPEQTQQQVIPVTLPGGNLQLQTQLGSLKSRVKREKPDFSQLPKFQPKLTAQLDISASLHDAADQAARAETAMQRMMAQAQAQIRVEEEFVADIVLADSTVIIAPRTALTVEAQQIAAAAPPPASPPEPLEPEASAPRVEPAPAEPAPTRKPSRPRPKSVTPPLTMPIETPQEPVIVEVYPLPPPDPVTPPEREVPPQAAQFIPGITPAPDRGPGAYSDSSSTFFSQLTAHLFRANQLALASAVRAGGRLTLDVRFHVARDGRILGAQVVRSTGNPALDRKAEQIILDASPVPQIANDMPQERLELSFPVDVYR